MRIPCPHGRAETISNLFGHINMFLYYEQNTYIVTKIIAEIGNLPKFVFILLIISKLTHKNLPKKNLPRFMQWKHPTLHSGLYLCYSSMYISWSYSAANAGQIKTRFIITS